MILVLFCYNKPIGGICMLEFMVKQFIPELIAVETKAKHILHKYNYLWLHANMQQIDVEERLWLPVLCLASAKTVKGINQESVQVASHLHLFNIATQLHLNLPKMNQKKLQQEIKNPILLGDLLYSSIFHDISQGESPYYLQDFAGLLESIHERVILRDYPFKDDFWPIHNDINMCGEMSEVACFLGARTGACAGEMMKGLKDLGYLLGVLKEVWNTNITYTSYLNCWYQAWNKIELLSGEYDFSLYENLLIMMGKKWHLKKPVMLKEVRA